MKTNLEIVKDTIAEFSDRKFGSDRPFTAPLHHLKKEVNEAIESGEMEEFADMQLLLLDSFRKKFPNSTTEELLNLCMMKIELCEKRIWGMPDENGVIEHVRYKLKNKII